MPTIPQIAVNSTPETLFENIVARTISIRVITPIRETRVVESFLLINCACGTAYAIITHSKNAKTIAHSPRISNLDSMMANIKRTATVARAETAIILFS